MTPLVSVVCLSYNHERFVQQAVQSVFDQTYSNIQLIVVDDFSSDSSMEAIRKAIAKSPETEIIRMEKNLGNCRAFNRGLQSVRGQYVIDLSADDILVPTRIEKGVALLEQDPGFGVQFSDAAIIDEDGKRKGFHSDAFPHATIPSGSIFSEILGRYFINSPTMMIRKSVLDELGGYDESLAYEDFDFWVRSSRRWKYVYTPEALVSRRNLKTSMGKRQYIRGSAQLRSTLRVCEKALVLCANQQEYGALKLRIRYEARRAVLVGSWNTAWGYWKLWRNIP